MVLDACADGAHHQQMGIGKRIEERLVELGLRRRDLQDRAAARCDVSLSDQTLSNLIKRDSARSESDWAIARALDTSVLWLVYGDERFRNRDPQTSLLAQEPVARYGNQPTHDETELLVGFRLATPEVKEIMLDAARKATAAQREQKAS